LRIIIFLFLLPFLLSCNEEKQVPKEYIYIINEVNDFLFVGKTNAGTGLFKYDFKTNDSQQFWYDKNEKVVELSYSENRINVFFITAKSYGHSGVFPYINKVKLYIVNPETMKADFVEDIGNGLQVFAEWKEENNFKVTMNSFEKTNANLVNHRTMIFNIYGRKLEDKTEIYDIMKQGYPQLPEKKINYTSPVKEYILQTRGSDSVSVYLTKNNSERFIAKINQQIKKISWKRNYLFFSSINILPGNQTLHSENPETSKLFVFSLKTNKIVEFWEGGGVKNFFITDSFIIFDTGFEENSRIIIYNFLDEKVIDEIKIEGGCGLMNIPEIPGYSA
jgi:hypothetical protein